MCVCVVLLDIKINDFDSFLSLLIVTKDLKLSDFHNKNHCVSCYTYCRSGFKALP